MSAAEGWSASGDGVLFWLNWATDPGGRRLLMAAGLAVVVWAIVRWLNSSGPQGLRPVAALGAAVIRFLGRMPVAIVAIALAFLPQLVSAMKRPDAGDRPTVVFILLDTVRLDHLGWGGSELDTSPRLDALARDGVAFTQTITQAPWTKPSVATILTGVIPGRTGATARRGPMLPRNRTLAEAYAAAGYRTMGLSSNPNIATVFGFRQGFLNWHEDTEATADTLIADARRWLGAEKDRPSFLYLHLNDAHYPYNPAPEYAGLFNHTGTNPHLDGITEEAFRTSLGEGFSEDDVEAMRLSYSEEIRYLDDQVGQLVEDLLAEHDNMLVVITADHGEEFLEHGDLGHGHSLHEELIRIPLQFAWSPALGEKLGLKSAHEDAQVRHMDLMPTLLELCDLTWPEGERPFDGQTLSPYLRGEEVQTVRPAFSETDNFGSPISGPPGPLRSWRLPNWKLVETDPHVEKAANRLWLFHLAADPGEHHNLAHENPEQRDLLRKALQASGYFLGPDARLSSGAVISGEQSDALAAMGYTEGNSADALEAEPYLDPRAIPWLQLKE